ncbi:hypothetical protein L249_0588 [Ophiocordyceps polyrhachis-furcata BCC 54312]|uniref:CCHC-type domain-containing protein n=1 Tax=Ophiocordyceps polyrhachis-furcata BCC 54312 TaxID=1330021 RepID=A0A367LES4_9HYPO|nr:hypothetical protein L249_0588 [Ophiocordyceps polyrhachis-furcata BCC 54312]
MDQMRSLILSGDKPVITLHELPGQRLPVLELHNGSDFPYVAISHVWADGLGSTAEKGLPVCQLRRLTSLVSETKPGTALWIDALCIPEAAEARNLAITMMASIYKDATAVLVLDSGLQSCRSDEHLGTKLLRTLTCGWMRRLWTLQEATLSRELHLVLADGPWPLKALIPLYGDLYYRRPLLDLAKQLFPLIKRSAYGSCCLGDVARALTWRNTSKRSDETLAIAGLLGVQPSTLTAIRPEGRIMRLMQAIGRVPRNVLFLGGKKLQLPGFSWAPMSFMAAHGGAAEGTELSVSDTDAVVTPRGLAATYFAFILPSKVPKEMNCWRLRDTKTGKLYSIAGGESDSTEPISYDLLLTMNDTDNLRGCIISAFASPPGCDASHAICRRLGRRVCGLASRQLLVFLAFLVASPSLLLSILASTVHRGFESCEDTEPQHASHTLEMTDSLRGRQAQEARCYNCGSHGHWAVACPEPTRKTPAGLAAWRNASAGNVKNQSYNPGSRRSKGPIITKYSPPSFASNMGSSYPPPPPPPPPGGHPPTGLHLAHPYTHAFQQGYPQPALSYHSSPQFTPSATYGLPHYGQPAHLGLPSPLPGPPAGSCSNLDYGPPRPPYHASFPRSAPSQKPPHNKSAPRNARKSELPFSIAKPPMTRLSHPLPPKPPPSHDQMQPQRDVRNRGKINRHHNQGKGPRSARSSDFEAPVSHDSLAADRSLPGNSPASGRHGDGNAYARRPSQSPGKGIHECEANNVRATSVTRAEDKLNGDVAGKSVESLESAITGKGVSAWSVDEPDRSDFAMGREKSLSLRSNDTGDTAVSCTVEASDEHEDGEISSDEDVRSPTPHDGATAEEKSNSPAVEDHWRPKRRYSDEWDEDVSYAKRLKPTGASRIGDKFKEDGHVDDDLWDSLDVPRQADRKRRGSAGSRHSSVSSKSSDLNSLEAELLGRPVKQRPVEEASPRPRSRSERRPVSKPKKRRQNNTNSAYSRRW